MCEFCGNDKDIIFPFQLSKCQRCEGEPCPRAPPSHNFFPHSWKNWKIPKPRRLARALSRDKREGEGGEEDVQPGGEVEVIGGEQEKVEAELMESSEGRRDSERAFQNLASGKLAKTFSRIKGNEKEQERTGSTDLEREEELKMCSSKTKKDPQHLSADSNDSDRSIKSGDERPRREKVSLLKVLQMGRLRKSRSKDRGDSETHSSWESLNERGVQSLSRSEAEAERGTNLSEDEGGQTENQGGAKEEPKLQTEAEAAAITTEKVSGKLQLPHPFASIFSKEKDKGNGDRCRSDSDGKGEGNTESEGHDNPVVTTQSSWRSSKTRKARRITRSRKMKARGRDNTETSEEDSDHQDCVEGTQGKSTNK